MKKLLVITGILFMFASCGELEKPQSTQTVVPKENVINYGYYTDAIYEIEYKGHTYGLTEVHGGRAMFHAGHCKCNQPK
jgi:hypothetical protein